MASLNLARFAMPDNPQVWVALVQQYRTKVPRFDNLWSGWNQRLRGLVQLQTEHDWVGEDEREIVVGRHLRFCGWRQLLRPEEQVLAYREIGHARSQVVHYEHGLTLNPLPAFEFPQGAPPGVIDGIRIYDLKYELLVEGPVTRDAGPLLVGSTYQLTSFQIQILVYPS